MQPYQEGVCEISSHISGLQDQSSLPIRTHQPRSPKLKHLKETHQNRKICQSKGERKREWSKKPFLERGEMEMGWMFISCPKWVRMERVLTWEGKRLKQPKPKDWSARMSGKHNIWNVKWTNEEVAIGHAGRDYLMPNTMARHCSQSGIGDHLSKMEGVIDSSNKIIAVKKHGSNV